ncbi:dihydrodipicolinate synthase family protein [Flavihumibacter stibioxidans]|uniref:Dihydrodipicolinate synthase family protein n=1 Tax=Flavihumibacter stibioxidans TaxID=1834163 RepID=A0ABR7M9Y0_9BACT|nr:dihydrodipicolinate synthase family protein [Flavihumibacter stibioxidans]MBC6491393.1 dihydrodipicolinate synthase family protein [Flavihumibacter stibioxidans]
MSNTLDPILLHHLQEGTVIPAHPLALTADRQLDEARQRLLTRYYIASGAGGMAVGVHSTQFEIRDPQVNLYEPVLRLAVEELSKAAPDRPFLKVAGICGPTEQALKEAILASGLGYDMALLSMGGLAAYSEADLLARTRAVAAIMPVFGFYLQPSVGGRIFSFDFWQAFAAIPNVLAIKVAAFNRYQTLDVMRAVACSPRAKEIALYTGNDDNIIADLLTTYRFQFEGRQVEKSFVGGLLGQWAVWTSKAVDLLQRIKSAKAEGRDQLPAFLSEGVALTDVNAAIFDPAHQFHGCIPGIHEVLRRQGLLAGTWCLNEKEQLSPGQAEEITRVYECYPHLNDDAFVQEFLRQQSL